MLSYLTVIAALPLLVWLYMLALRGGFWRASRLTLSAQHLEPRPARIAAVIPARDEAEHIAQAIHSLLSQSDVDLRVFLVDDGSTDGTADAARRAADEAHRSADLTIIAGAPLPSGWTGKLWAMKQGIEQARRASPDFVLLTDADIAHAPGSIARLASLAERDGYDLASLMVRLECHTHAERLLIPAFVFFFFMLYPPRWISDRHAGTAGAAGGCMLMRPAAFDAIGGIETIRAEVIDDCALAAAIKKSGGRIWLGLADTSASLRPYGSFSAIGNMIARSAFSQLRHSTAALFGTIVGLAAMFLLPIALLFTRQPLLVALGAAAWLAMAICYRPVVRYYELGIWRAFTLPIAAVFYMGATVLSAVRYWSGRGGQWKGRVQDTSR